LLGIYHGPRRSTENIVNGLNKTWRTTSPHASRRWLRTKRTAPARLPRRVSRRIGQAANRGSPARPERGNKSSTNPAGPMGTTVYWAFPVPTVPPPEGGRRFRAF
jgi:hypothetical protein